ncbi:DNA-3-methyladenine glycosylase 1 [Smittium mucronatum]|uniref:DNA-3-methyladenine glycosylase 1 n=1 Tax=Smittium mucronatum TaxID=133383 RepID=A0A1R0H6Y1_9FUNG|nr:DNA-3-methyladenine glycosylase 1 [Smittium mucronatum]
MTVSTNLPINESESKSKPLKSRVTKVEGSKVIKKRVGLKKESGATVGKKTPKEKLVKFKEAPSKFVTRNNIYLYDEPLIIDGVKSDKIFENALELFTERDPKLIKLIGKCPKPKFLFAGNTERSAFESLVKYVVSQQLSRNAALSIFTKLRTQFGFPLDVLNKEFTENKTLNDNNNHVLNQNDIDFTISPESILGHEPDELRTVGLSSRKAEYVLSLAAYFKSRNLQDKDFLSMTNDEISLKLTKIKGIGQWTIDMFLMFYLSRLDVVPTLDLGVKKAMCRHFNVPYTKKSPTHQELIDLSARWAPYRSIASWYMYSMDAYSG